MMPPDAVWIERARAAVSHRSGGVEADSVELLPPHASLRRYARIRRGDTSAIVMLLPHDRAPDEVGGPVAGASLRDDPFVAVQRWLERAGVPVPAIYHIDPEHHAIWLEDLGNVDFDTWVTTAPELLEERYTDAVGLLADFQRCTTNPPPLVNARCFDGALMATEVEHYLEWRVGAWLGRTPTQRLRRALDALVGELSAMPVVPMHRDFQSHNLMVSARGLVVLDFQDAMLGPLVYDAVALLRDSYVSIPPPILGRLLQSYAEHASAAAGYSVDDVQRWFHMQTVQRKLKDAARFVFIDKVKGNSSFLKYIDTSVAYVGEALHALGDEASELRNAIAEVDPQAAG